jgi:urease gamma subunit
MFATIMVPAQAADPITIDNTNKVLLNTGYQPVEGRDPLWRSVMVEQGADLSSVDAASWIPAYVFRNDAWESGVAAGILNAQWISNEANAEHDGCYDFFYRADFALAANVNPANFSLPMSFMADNAITAIYVNGTDQSSAAGLQLPTEWPYTYPGFYIDQAATVTIKTGWQAGLNSLVVRIASCGPGEGFLASFPSIPSVLSEITLKQTYSQKEWTSRVSAGGLSVLLARQGDGVLRIGGWGRTWTLTTASAIQRFLPSTGKAGPLTASVTDGRVVNALASETMAAKLNIAGYAGLGSQRVAKGIFAGVTVAEVIDQADALLGGAPVSVKVNDLLSAVVNINASYAGGSSSKYLSNP